MATGLGCGLPAWLPGCQLGCQVASSAAALPAWLSCLVVIQVSGCWWVGLGACPVVGPLTLLLNCPEVLAWVLGFGLGRVLAVQMLDSVLRQWVASSGSSWGLSLFELRSQFDDVWGPALDSLVFGNLLFHMVKI